tara:strand:- start:615 stop:1391 length:777 start_codon:yes stop_codon:yes gene_type:complete
MRKFFLLTLYVLPFFAAAQVVINSGLTESISTLPGNSETITVVLKNISDDPRRVTFLLQDYINDCEKGYVYVDTVVTGESCQPWTRLEAEELILFPREKREFLVQITVPDAFAGPSARTCLFINNTPLIDTLQEEGVFQFAVEIRYGINILYSNPKIAAEIDLYAQNLSIDSVSDVRSVQISLMNRGSQSTSFTSKLDLLDQNGNTVLSSNSQRQTIQPGQCRIVSFPVKDASGPLELILMSETKEGEIFGFTESITL